MVRALRTYVGLSRNVWQLVSFREHQIRSEQCGLCVDAPLVNDCAGTGCGELPPRCPEVRNLRRHACVRRVSRSWPCMEVLEESLASAEFPDIRISND